MKNIFKIVSASLLIMLILFSNLITVDAQTVPNTIVVNHVEAGYSNNLLNINRSFAIKKTSDGKYMYCMQYNLPVPQNTKYAIQGESTDNGVAYILAQAANVNNDKDYFITQTALWIYMLDKGMMKDSSYGSIKSYRSTVNSSAYDNNEIAKAIRNLVSKAKTASKLDKTTNLEVTESATFTLKDNNYVSSVIKVNTTANDYEVKLNNAPTGSSTKKVDGGFTITVPTSNMKSGGVEFSATVTASQNVTSVYTYNSTVGNYQTVAAPYTSKVDMQDEINLSIESNVLTIYKKDKDTDKTLSGAVLTLKDSKGNVIKKWVTSDKGFEVYNLPSGKYTITEQYAPDGYELNSEGIAFVLQENFKSRTINFYNEKKKEQPIVPEKTPEQPPKEEVPVTPEEVVIVPVESTGMNTSLIPTAAGIAMITGGIAVIYRKMKKESK